MTDKIAISASIVLYNEDITDLSNAVNSFLNCKLSKKLYLIDNTNESRFKNAFKLPEVEYIPIKKNIGFGAAHNKVLGKINELSSYHLILNPDVVFNPLIINNLIQEIKKDSNLAMIAPKVLFPNGKHQFSCRRYPSLFELFIRRIPSLKYVFKNKYSKGVYKDKDLTKPFFAEYLTGCFQLYKTEDLLKINGFDERYFLYMEDVDICKKLDQIGKKKMYYPKEEITHILKQGSTKSLKLFIRHSMSVLKYFLKWGI